MSDLLCIHYTCCFTSIHRLIDDSFLEAFASVRGCDRLASFRFCFSSTGRLDISGFAFLGNIFCFVLIFCSLYSGGTPFSINFSLLSGRPQTADRQPHFGWEEDEIEFGSRNRNRRDSVSHLSLLLGSCRRSSNQ